MAHLYMQHRVGDLVDVAPVARRGRPNSEGGRGYIIRRSSSPSSVTADSFDIEYIIPKKKLSKEVTPDRLSPATIDNVARPRSASVVTPSLLSPHFQASKRLLSTTPNTVQQKKAKSTSNLVTSAVLLDRNRQSKPKTKNGTDHPILVYLRRNNSDKGYLRRNDAKAAGLPVPKQGSHMSAEEKNNLLLLRNALSGVEFKSNNVTSLLAHAFGVSNRQIQRLEKKAGTDLQPKTRFDAGTNLLTSTKLQENWFSAYNFYKKAQRRQQSTIANTLLDSDDSNFKEQWDAMTPQQQAPYVAMSDDIKKRVPFLIGEIQTALQTTGGYCTWRQLESYLSQDGVPVISYQQIRRLVMGLPDSQYTSTKLLPALTAAHIIKRKLWCQQFWIFWDSSRKLIRKRILLVHMDEKWFYGIVVRMNNKLVPFLGMEPATTGQVSVHHKNYRNKFMCICSSIYLPHDNNDITAGGQGFHGTLIRAGHEEVAEDVRLPSDWQKQCFFDRIVVVRQRSGRRGQLFLVTVVIVGFLFPRLCAS